jgi:AraC-like DNA-binding protein/quercetin dioxygenase-like cupin family protein
MTTRPSIGPLTPHLFRPDRARPVRAKRQHLLAATRVVPHAHPWGQVAISTTGVVRVTMPHGTTIVPPSRALWVPPGVEHAVTVVEDADLLTLYVAPGRRGLGLAASAAEAARWRQCRVLDASRLLLALALELDARPDAAHRALDRETLQREKRIAALFVDELRHAPQVPLGIALPAEKRLRRLCEAMLDDPSRHASLDAWAAGAGASARTIARLFRSELGTTFVRWREQVLLARAVPLAARRLPMAAIAAELGYASPSAFAAMVRRSVGTSPLRFFRAGA